MITVGEHTFDETLLDSCNSQILDIGCRGFSLCNFFTGSGQVKVYNVDCDDLGEFQPFYYRLAITNIDGTVNIVRTSDPQGTYIVSHQRGEEKVTALTLESFSDMVRVKFWDLIKMDIEGSEYEVIMSMTKPIAKQLSIEFHLHTGAYDSEAVQKMEIHLWSLGYETIQHERTRQHGLNPNFWDSLFILK